jgi:hypothetical protein
MHKKTLSLRGSEATDEVPRFLREAICQFMQLTDCFVGAHEKFSLLAMTYDGRCVCLQV